MFSRILLCAVIGVAITLSTPIQSTESWLPERPERGDATGMKHYRKALYLVHQSCAAEATHREMSRTEVDYCATAYMLLKLSFLDGVTHLRYRSMSAKTRAVANRKGYDAYRAWLHRDIAKVQ